MFNDSRALKLGFSYDQTAGTWLKSERLKHLRVQTNCFEIIAFEACLKASLNPKVKY